jgi:hypothetical protein
MSDSKSYPRWKRAFTLALKIYVGLCTMLVTAYLALVLWSICFPKSSLVKSSLVITETMVMASYGEYVAKEHPKRADYFWRLAMALERCSKQAPVPAADTLKYLGTPDLISGTTETGTLVYFYDHASPTNKWAMYASFKEGKLAGIAFNDATVNDHSKYQPYLTR